MPSAMKGMPQRSSHAPVSTVLVVGATGSIGRLVVAEALRQGLRVRPLVRNAGRARGLPAQAERRGERLLRASGLPYTVVRPGWFDCHASYQHRLTLLQGDTRHAGNPSDGVIARAQIAQVLVASLRCDAAIGKTFELVAERGAAQADLAPLFAALDADVPGELDAVRDARNLPLAAEPPPVRQALVALGAHAAN